MGDEEVDFSKLPLEERCSHKEVEGAQEITDPPESSEAANKEPDNKQPEVVPRKTRERKSRAPQNLQTGKSSQVSSKSKCPCDNTAKDQNEDWIACDKCKQWFHGSCVNLNTADITKLTGQDKEWLCNTCLDNSSKDCSQNTRVPCTLCDKTFLNLKRLSNHMNRFHPEETKDPPSHPKMDENLLKALMIAKTTTKIANCIPKGARPTVAEKLRSTIDLFIRKNDLMTFSEVMLFSYKTMHLNAQGKKPVGRQPSLTNKIKENVEKMELPENKTKQKGTLPLSKRIEMKVNNYEIQGAVKILSSDDKLAPCNCETLTKLRSKHPAAPDELDFSDLSEEHHMNVSVTSELVQKAINSFKPGSAAGLDGLKPQLLKDVTSQSAGQAGKRVLESITNLVNFLLHGKLNPDLCPILYGASLCAKPDGGIRPIAVGNTFRRLTAKVACMISREEIHNYLSPLQLGVATKLSTETAIHAVRSYAHDTANRGKVLVKIDFANAFNSVSRDVMLKEVKLNMPNLLPFMYQCYRHPTYLVFGEHTIDSATGCQQGDNCGPMAFSLAIHPIVQSLTAELNLWYLDDGTIADTADNTLYNLQKIINEAKKIGLKVNTNKCELFFCSGIEDEDTINKFNEVCPGIRVIQKENLSLLGVPIFETGLEASMEKKFRELQLLISRLKDVNAHIAYTLLKNCLFIPKLTYFIRTCPLWKFPSITSEFDSMLLSSLTTILNTSLNQMQYTQATLPIKLGGLGIRKMSDLSLPAFLSSTFSVQKAVSDILKFMDKTDVYMKDEALESWKEINPNLTPGNLCSQKNWDILNMEHIVDEDLKYTTPKEKARILAIQQNESGAWLNALPSKNIGTLMDNVTFRICAALRLGCPIVQRHTCHCGTEVTEDGTHGLACQKSKARHYRHAELNQIISRSLATVHIPSTLEPTGLFNDDEKRPDGVTLTCFSRGQPLAWDVTCVDTLCQTHITKTSITSGAAAEDACRKKHSKYGSLSPNYLFYGLAVETFGPWCKEMKEFLRFLGGRLEEESGDKRSTSYLYQRISIAIQRGNSACVLETLPETTPLNEIFIL